LNKGACRWEGWVLATAQEPGSKVQEEMRASVRQPSMKDVQLLGEQAVAVKQEMRGSKESIHATEES
jgi:hypothetical protein